MLDLCFGFHGTISRWKFFIGYLVIIAIVTALAVVIAIVLAMTGAIGPDVTMASPVMLFYVSLLVILSFWSQLALYTKHLGWSGPKGLISWGQVALVILGAIWSLLSLPETGSGILTGLSCLLFLAACLTPGRSPDTKPFELQGGNTTPPALARSGLVRPQSFGRAKAA